MRLGLLADIHGNIHALEACLGRLSAAGVDRILCAGDVIGYYPFVNEVIEALQIHDVTTIRGNHEAYLLGVIGVSDEKFRHCSLDWTDRHLRPEHRAFLERLPESYCLEADGTRLSMFHGSPWSIEEYVYPDDSNLERFAGVDTDIVVLGHTHIPMVRSVNQRLIVNAGSCGQPRDYNPLAAYAVLDTSTLAVELGRVDYDVDAVCRRVADEGLWSELGPILRRTRSSSRGSLA